MGKNKNLQDWGAAGVTPGKDDDNFGNYGDHLIKDLIKPGNQLVKRVKCFISQLYLRSVIHNLRILWTETAWARKYEPVLHELVQKYQDFFCEPINHEENIEWHDWRDGLENRKVSFDDETSVVQDFGSERPLEAAVDFHDDGLCQAEDSELALSLSKLKVENAHNTSTRGSAGKKRKKKKAGKKEDNSPVILWLRRDICIYDNRALVRASSFDQPVIPLFLWSESEEGRLACGGATKVWLEQALAVFAETLRDSCPHLRPQR